MPKPKTIKAQKKTITLRVYQSDVQKLKKYADELNEKYEYQALRQKYEKPV